MNLIKHQKQTKVKHNCGGHGGITLNRTIYKDLDTNKFYIIYDGSFNTITFNNKTYSEVEEINTYGSWFVK